MINKMQVSLMLNMEILMEKTGLWRVNWRQR